MSKFVPLKCGLECCNLSYVLVQRGTSRHAIVTYNGRTFSGWDPLREYLGIGATSLRVRRAQGECLKGRRADGQLGPRSEVSTAQLLATWR
jgi:hypothetical protein